jgi:hypothetical protein
MEESPPLPAPSPTKGHLRKKRYDERLLYETESNGGRVQTRWRIDVYVTEGQRESLAEIARKVGRRNVIGRLLALADREPAPPPEPPEPPPLPLANSLMWWALARDLNEILRPGRQIDTPLVHELASTVDRFIKDVAAEYDYLED